jgi:hypothetical protein
MHMSEDKSKMGKIRLHVHESGSEASCVRREDDKVWE